MSILYFQLYNSLKDYWKSTSFSSLDILLFVFYDEIDTNDGWEQKNYHHSHFMVPSAYFETFHLEMISS